MPPETLVAWVEDFADGLTAAIRGLGAHDCAVAGQPGPRAVNSP